MLRVPRNERGIGLVEILSALTLTGMLTGAIYSVYILQNKSFTIQNELAEMTQNLRAGIFLMERELRMAGYDPTGDADAGIVTATATTITFTADIGGDNPGDDSDGALDDADENVTYSLFDADGDGINDLGRNPGSGNSAIAENVDALNFVYLDASSNQLDDGGGSVVASIDQIRSIQVSLVARTAKIDSHYKNSAAYENQQATTIYTAPDDNYRRKVLSTQITCRNLGL